MGSNCQRHARSLPPRVAAVWIWGIINCGSEWCSCCNLMFLSHRYPTDGWAVVWLSVVETVGQVGVGAELPIPLRCGVRRPLAAVQQQQWWLSPSLPSSLDQKKGKRGGRLLFLQDEPLQQQPQDAERMLSACSPPCSVADRLQLK